MKMTEGQLRALVARILSDTNPSNCDGDRAQVMIKGDPEFTTRFEEFINTYEVRITVPSSILEPLLEEVGTVDVPANSESFIAKEKFKLKKEGGICSYLGDNFKAGFLKGDGITYPPFNKSTLRYHKLLNLATDMPQKPRQPAIIPELGGEAKAETVLSEMFSLMEKQKNGEDGVLLNNGYANIFYIRDQNDVLRSVGVYWNGGGWSVNAFSVENPYEWRAGRQVFSRNSVLTPSATVSAQV